MSTDFPAELVELQKRSDAAWAAVEAHRKDVDARRARDAAAEGAVQDPVRPWVERPLPPWSDADDARHGELMAAVRTAAEALRAGVLAAGLVPDYETVQGLKDAARPSTDAAPASA